MISTMDQAKRIEEAKKKLQKSIKQYQDVIQVATFLTNNNKEFISYMNHNLENFEEAIAILEGNEF
ncbi:MAG: hypothetical protein D8H99_48155 [Streptococcus sp.]|nr:MAG: hypothetical protein D8H99_48155 [Streptococcus sp.]